VQQPLPPPAVVPEKFPSQPSMMEFGSAIAAVRQRAKPVERDFRLSRRDPEGRAIA